LVFDWFDFDFTKIAFLYGSILSAIYVISNIENHPVFLYLSSKLQCHPWSLKMKIHCMRPHGLGLYLKYISKETCTCGSLKLSCDSRFQRAFTASICVFKVITLVGSNQRNYFENVNACSKRALKTNVAT